MFNKITLSADALHNVEKRRILRKKLAQQMIFDTNFLKFERFFYRFMFLVVIIFCISHFISYGHFPMIHTHG